MEMANERTCSEGSFYVLGGMRVWDSPASIKRHETRVALGRTTETKQRWTRGTARED